MIEKLYTSTDAWGEMKFIALALKINELIDWANRQEEAKLREKNIKTHT